jgi:hypothetical protein
MPALMINQINSATDTTTLVSPDQTDPTLFVENTSFGGYDRDDRLQPDAIATFTGSGIGCNAVAEENFAIQGTSFGAQGVVGRSQKNSGVVGQNGVLGGFSGPADPAVLGVAFGPTGDGVSGMAMGNGNGVSGKANGPSNAGVVGSGAFGVVGVSSGNNNAAVFGGASGNSPGVWGQTSSATWPGVEGFATGTNNGVRGVSNGPAGPASNGVVGFSTNGNGVVGIAVTPGSFGGVFIGGLTVTGGPKSAAVKHRDGSHRLFYSLESPESWFEDFGRARLLRGKAEVKLDSSFASFVRMDDYHVFLQPEGTSKGLYVNRRSRTGFSVREHGGAASTMAFSYRIVARRKDLKIERFKPVRLPVFDKNEFLKRSKSPAEVTPLNASTLESLAKKPMFRRRKPARLGAKKHDIGR